MTTLKQKLDEFRDSLEDRVGPEAARALAAADARMRGQGFAEQALGVGEMAPDFALRDAHGAIVRLTDRLRSGPVVVAFTRGGWCPFCSLTLRAYEEVAAEVREAGGSILALAPEPPERAQGTCACNGVSFPMLWDEGLAVAQSWRLVFELDPELRPFFRQHGKDLPVMNRSGDWRLPLPATYVVARDGRIARAVVDTAAYRRMEPREIVAAVTELQLLAAT